MLDHRLRTAGVQQPLLETTRMLNNFCSILQLDVLRAQAARHAMTDWSDDVTIAQDSSATDKSLHLTYWRQSVLLAAWQASVLQGNAHAASMGVSDQSWSSSKTALGHGTGTIVLHRPAAGSAATPAAARTVAAAISTGPASVSTPALEGSSGGPGSTVGQAVAISMSAAQLERTRLQQSLTTNTYAPSVPEGATLKITPPNVDMVATGADDLSSTELVIAHEPPLRHHRTGQAVALRVNVSNLFLSVFETK